MREGINPASLCRITANFFAPERGAKKSGVDDLNQRV
jgi:hypothetical protein